MKKMIRSSSNIKGYKYYTKHGLGPGSLPSDVHIIKQEDLDNYMTRFWTDRFLTTKELNYYDIYPETRNSEFDRIYSSKKSTRSAIMAADDNEDLLDEDYGIEDTIDDIADTVDDLQDDMEDIKEDDIGIEIDNNIDGKYIAECEKCHGIFISAISESEQFIESVTGTCPLCDEDTVQYLKWIVRKVE